MPDPSDRLPMPAFVAEIDRLIARGFVRQEVHRFLAGHLIEPASLTPYLGFAAGRYTRHLVVKNDHVEILVLCWDTAQRAPVHGHEGELCWARVERGALRFTNYRLVSETPLVVEPVAEPVLGHAGFLDGPADLHAVENPPQLGSRAVSLHVYSKPFPECDIYDLARGERRRVRLAYDSTPESRAALGREGR